MTSQSNFTCGQMLVVCFVHLLCHKWKVILDRVVADNIADEDKAADKDKVADQRHVVDVFAKL